MVVTVHSQHFTVTPSIRQFVVDNLQEPLERVWPRAGADTQLDVELREVRGGNRQGPDKECRCILYMPRGPRFVITEVTEDMRKSIHQARKRLMRRVRQYVGHKVNGARHHRKHYLADMVSTELQTMRYPRSEDVRGARETLR